ncbi:hypothetical protein Tco_1248053 [Tanacetum coccineum]
MVHSNMLKTNWLDKKPVKHWYQSHGSDQGRRPMPIDQEEVTSRFLQRVSPQRRSPWNNKKKNLSPECKEMLMHRIKEIEAFNASKESKEHGEDSRTQKERRASIHYMFRGKGKWKAQEEIHTEVYYDTAERPWNDTRMPGKEVGEGSRIGAREDPQGMDKGKAGIGETQGALREGINQETRFGVKLESNTDEDNAEIGSMTGSNDFEVIV